MSNTIFEGLSYSVEEMIEAVHDVITHQGIAYMASNIKSEEMTESSALLLTHKILHILASLRGPRLSGVIQIDEKYLRETQKGSKHLVSFLDGKSKRNKRYRYYRSECGIFGPEFINVLCAVDDKGHYWAKCVSLGPMGMEALKDFQKNINNVAYICTDSASIYSDWCKQQKVPFRHYVEPSGYRKERLARGYHNTDDINHTLTAEEFAINEKINRQMYKEKRYPHLENMGRPIGFDEFNTLKRKFGLGINAVNSFHSRFAKYLEHETQGVASKHLHDYVGAYTFLVNYKTAKQIKTFSLKDAENILVIMTKFTINRNGAPTRAELNTRTISDLPRPSARSVTDARNRIKKAREVIIDPMALKKAAYEGQDAEFIFNKAKFFRQLGTTRLNELAKLHGVYDRKEHKNDRIRRLSELPNADDIIFHEISIALYGDINAMKEAFDKLPEKKKKSKKKAAP